MHTVKEDPVRRGLLFAGTERAVFVSFDSGDSWQSLQLNLPSTSMRDLEVHENDLVIATHGRGFWVLDPCRANGQSCESGDQCCNGYCQPDPSNPSSLVCTDTASCAGIQERCVTAADCCDTSDLCINGFCATAPIL